MTTEGSAISTTQPVPAGGPAHLRATLAQVADPDQLATAWDDVLVSDWDHGVVGLGVTRFACDAEQHLSEIAAQLTAGTYQPGRLAPVALPRPDGQTRLLHVPSVRDRIVERSILAVLTPVIDPWLGPFSYAYRRVWALPMRSRPSRSSAMRDSAGWPAPTFMTASARSRYLCYGACSPC